MALSTSLLLSWIAYTTISYYVIRPIPYGFLRFLFTLIPCALLTWITCQDLPKFHASSAIILAISWLVSIRSIQLTVCTTNLPLTFQSYLAKILWTFLPIRSQQSLRYQWPISTQLIIIVLKFFVNHWTYRWSISCETRVSFARILLFYSSMMTISYFLDAEAVFIRLLTWNKYTLESFTNLPILSTSLREFWGRRYNQIVNTILKESIFQPICAHFSAPTVAGLMTFIISGLLHAHLALVLFDDYSALFPAFMFFLVHGLVCCFEANVNRPLPGYIGWLTTHVFLIITAPLMLAPFIREGSEFLALNPPPLINIEWIPKMPTPDLCL